MIELSPNIDSIPLPRKALGPSEHIDAVLAQIHSAFEQLTKARQKPRFLATIDIPVSR